jgi:hypothetical protein
MEEDNIKDPICDTCGHYLTKGTITQQERERRQKNRTTYCDNCNQLVFSVPIGIIKNELYRKVGGDYDYCFLCLSCFFFFDVIGSLIVFISWGFDLTYFTIFLVFLGIFSTFVIITNFLYKKHKRERDEIDANLRDLGCKFFCSKCLEGVKLKKNSPIESFPLTANLPINNVCPYCGNENPSENKYCGNCGNEL